jgi:hypothetical protein
MTNRQDGPTQFEAGVILRLNAIVHWLGELHAYVARPGPGAMADHLEARMQTMRNMPPSGPEGLSPQQLDDMMVVQQPVIELIGRTMVEHLRSMQAHTDETAGQQGVTLAPEYSANDQILVMRIYMGRLFAIAAGDDPQGMADRLRAYSGLFLGAMVAQRTGDDQSDEAKEVARLAPLFVTQGRMFIDDLESLAGELKRGEVDPVR